MANPRQLRNLTPGPIRGAATAALALAIVFSLTVVTAGTAQAQTYQVLYTFTGGNDGAGPYAGLTWDKGGKLYGTTHSGNSGTNWGNVFQLRRSGSSWTFNPLGLFDGTLSSRVTFGPDGLLYSVSPNNIAGYVYGYAFSMRPKVNACVTVLCPWDATVIYGFSGGTDGANPRFGDIIFDPAGNIYGTTPGGGNGNHGVVYELTRSGGGWTEHVLYAFSGSDGSQPFAGIIFDSAGNAYGTTAQGGQNGFGTVYELSPSGRGWTEKVLYSYQNGSDGSTPIGGLIFDSSGDLYGANDNGGSGGAGTVFELTPSGGGWTYHLLNSFTGGAQCGPRASLAFDSLGNLLGTTYCGGANNQGNVFKLTPSGGSWTYTSLYDFTNGADGAKPISNVIFDSSGDLYGTASLGGNTTNCTFIGCGVVWEITP